MIEHAQLQKDAIGWAGQDYRDSIVDGLDRILNDPSNFVEWLNSNSESNAKRTLDAKGLPTNAILMCASDLAGYCKRPDESEGSYRFLAMTALENLKSKRLAFSTVNLGVFDPFSNMYSIGPLGGSYSRRSIASIVFGLGASQHEFHNCVAKIEAHDENGRYLGTGSGVFIRDGNGQKFVLSCSHCFLESGNLIGKFGIAIGDVKATPLALHVNKTSDFALLNIEADEPLVEIGIGHADVLDRVISFGYPRLLQRCGNPLLVHSGEVNGFIGDKEEGTLRGIMSNRVSPGNSGGPVINELGDMVGIVRESIENQYEGTTVSHHTFVPSEQILHLWKEGSLEPIDLH